MFIIIIISIIRETVEREWQIIDYSFTGLQISQNEWQIYQECDCFDCHENFNISTCNSNDLQYVKLSKDYEKLFKSYDYSTYQTQIIYNVNFDNASYEEDERFYVFYNQTKRDQQNQTLYYNEYKYNELTQQSNDICNGGSNDYPFNVSTNVVTTTLLQNSSFYITFCFNARRGRAEIRNVFVYIKPCHPSCKTCSGPNNNQCISCFEGNENNGKCQCQSSNNNYILQNFGCKQECKRSYEISDSNKICISDQKVQEYLTFFNQSNIQSNIYPLYLPFNLIEDQFNIKNSYYIQYQCNSKDFVGKFNFNEGIQYQMDQNLALAKIRLRITFYLFNLIANSKLDILFDNIIVSQIIKTNTDYDSNGLQYVFINDEICDSKSYKLIRIEVISQIYTNTPNIKIQGKLQQSSEYWGFRNFTIDIITCQENCQICQDSTTCKICKNSYFLYKGTCVLKCPIHSANCIDYEDIIPNSRYLFKGFYDFNMTFDEITSYFDTSSNPNTKTGQKFSFFPDKFVLGGSMVWNGGTYTKTLLMNQFTYANALSIHFNFTFGDAFSGTFQFKINSNPIQSAQKTGLTGQNILGKNDNEYTKYFYHQITSFTQNIVIEFSCTGGQSNYKDNFCAISEYFIIVHYQSQSCLTTEFQQFDTLTQKFICQTCTQIGCKTCNSLEQCTSCTNSLFYLKNGQCICYPFYYLSGSNCEKCNKYCENCDGSSNNNCITCVLQYKRGIKFNQCLCLPGYYDNGIDVQCFPICGDQITVIDEDCDDGNNDPFDGCDQCKFSCHYACEICVKGYCYQCLNGYQKYQNLCIPIYNDNLLVRYEECDDNNKTPYDGCFNGQFSCTENCIDCQFGICYQCDEINGWYLDEQNICQPFCGDKILVQNYEKCDDGNNIPSDGCDNCQLMCKDHCLICINGYCSQCETGFELKSLTQNCIPKCGDLIILASFEDCDDGNIIEFDGCYNCKLSCQEVCTDCQIYGCQECNIQGWQLNIQLKKCEPICGDGIIIQQYEQCDDLIDENCQNCKFICQDSCQLCYYGQCNLCKIGYVLNKIEKKCYYQSGDNQKVYLEECDDNNNIQNDGCYLSKFQCQLECENCVFGNCLQCNIGYQLNNFKCFEINDDNLIVGKEQCDDKNLEAQDGCFQNRFDCPEQCLNCVKGQCYECKKQNGYTFLQFYNNQCLSICGDGIKASNEQCDDGNQHPYDGCFECKYQCDNYCLSCQNGKCQNCQKAYNLNKKLNLCQSICGDSIKTEEEECDNGNYHKDNNCQDCQYKCHQKCISCLNGQCLQCSGKGWELDNVSMSCQTNCGDGYVQGAEECDGGMIQITGCKNCKYACQDECLKCSNGQCFECQQGWILDYDICIPFCGDKFVVGEEQCDDGNLIPYDGCFECKYQCQEQCTNCKLGICYECNVQGWRIKNHLCYVYCGDSYVVKYHEECDDGNLIKYDGCYNCEFQCEQLCTLCEQGICKECDIIGWTVEKNKCIPLCGDGLLYGSELCDDMNNNPNDGCHNCKFICDQYCILCEDGICLQCEIGRFPDQNVCESYCGDGLFVGANEKCDDGNRDDGDGCNFHCLIEDGYTCINIEGSYSECYNQDIPSFNLTLVKQNLSSLQEVIVTFDQKMKLGPQKNGKNLDDLIQKKILLAKSQDYQITTNYLNLMEFDYAQELIITFKIEFFYPIVEPVFQISFINDPIISQYNLTLQENKKTIKLNNVIVLSDSEKLIVGTAQNFNQALIYSLITIASLCILSGSADLFWNLMDQLQYLSYIKYTNIVFPSNLNAFFEIFNMITISPIMQYSKFDQIFNYLDGPLDYQIETQNKFKEDGINGYFFTNFQSFLFCLFTSYTFYFASKILLKIMNIANIQFVTSKNLSIGNKFIVLKKTIKSQIDDFHYNKLLRLVMSNCYDVIFASSIQLLNFNTQDNILLLNSILSFFVYIGFFIIAIYIYSIVWKFSRKTTLKKKNQFEALFEGVSQKNKNWTLQYNSILLIHKQLFISIIVFMQNQGEIQSIFIAINQTLFFCYLLITKPLSNSNEYYKIITTNVVTAINTITFLAYSFRIELNISPNFAVFLGWLHIGSFTYILVFSLLLDFMSQIRIIYEMIKSKYFDNTTHRNKIDLFY